MNEVQSETPRSSFSISLILLAGAILGLIISTVYFQIKMKQTKNENLAVLTAAIDPKSKLAQNMMNPSNPLPAPPEIFSFNGIVEKVGENSLVVRNFLGDKKAYDIKVTGDTRILKVGPSGILSVPENEKNSSGPPVANISDVRPDDKVIVEAFDSIKDRSEFEAKSIFITMDEGAGKVSGSSN